MDTHLFKLFPRKSDIFVYSVVIVPRWSLETASVPSQLLDQPRPSLTKPWSRFWSGFTPNITSGPRLRSSSGRLSHTQTHTSSTSSHLSGLKLLFLPLQPTAATPLWPLGLPQRSKFLRVCQDLPDCRQEMAFLWGQIIWSRGNFYSVTVFNF